MTWIRAKLGDHYFTLIAAFGVSLLLWFVPQINSSLVQIPTDGVQATLYLLFIVVAVLWLLTSILHFVGALPGSFFGLTMYWMGYLARRFRKLSAGIQGFVLPILMVLAGALIVIYVSSDHYLPGVGSMFSGAIRTLGACTAVAGVWLLFGTVLGPQIVTQVEKATISETEPREQTVAEIHRDVWQRAGQAISFLVFAALVGEVMWLLAISDLEVLQLVSLRIYSIWAVFQVCTTALIIAGLIDFLQRRTNWPWRFIAVLVALVPIVLSGAQWLPDNKVLVASGEQDSAPLTRVSSTRSEGPTRRDPWFDAIHDRLDEIPDGPVVLVTASGGGSRAALFTALSLEYLNLLPMDLPGADNTNPGEKSESTWGDHILAISSVSGGTLATARYIDLLRGDFSAYEHADPSEMKFTDNAEMLERAIVFAARLKATGGTSERELDAIGQVHDLLQGTGDSDSAPLIGECFQRVMKSKFVDEMGMDFMAPILRGFLQPLETRGDGLYTFWNQQFDWSDVKRSRWMDYSRTDASDPFWTPVMQPLFFANVTDIDSGRRVIIGCPALPRKLLPATGIVGSKEMESTKRKTSKSVRSKQFAPYSFSAIDPLFKTEMTLSRMVRLSSSFPFGFRPSVVGVYPTKDEELLGSNKLHLLDGGIIDNTGIDSFQALFSTLSDNAEWGDHDSIELLGRLRRRGVVLVEIDSGAKPSKVASDANPLRVIMQPISALSASSYTTALRTSETLLSDLEHQLSNHPGAHLTSSMLGDDFRVEIQSLGLSMTGAEIVEIVSGLLNITQRAPSNPTFLYDRMTCNDPSSNASQVMTSFALTPEDKGKVLTQFLVATVHWDATAKWMKQSLASSHSFDDAKQVARHQEQLETFVRLLEIGGAEIDKWNSERSASSDSDPSPETPSDADLRSRLRVPLAALTVAGFIADRNKSSTVFQAALADNPNLQMLAEQAIDRKTGDLLASAIASNMAAPSLSGPSANVSAAPASPGNSIWTDIAANLQSTHQYEEQSKTQNRTQMQQAPTSQSPRTQSPRTQDTKQVPNTFKEFKMQRESESADFYQRVRKKSN